MSSVAFIMWSLAAGTVLSILTLRGMPAATNGPDSEAIAAPLAGWRKLAIIIINFFGGAIATSLCVGLVGYQFPQWAHPFRDGSLLYLGLSLLIIPDRYSISNDSNKFMAILLIVIGSIAFTISFFRIED